MKKNVFLFLLFLSSVKLFAQVPESFSYQAVVRDGNGDIVAGQPVSVQISIISGSATGTVEFVENHYLTTNSLGLINVSIGSGSVVSGTMAAISWGLYPHFMKVEIDISGGSMYTDMGTVQLLSVPYSLFAKNAGNVFSGDYNDLINTPLIPSDLSQLNNDTGFITSPNDADADPANEIQNLSITGNDLSISGGNTVALPQNTYTAGSGIDISANSISNTAPDQTVVLTGSGATSVTGTYPSFTISSTDENTTYSAGSGMALSGTAFNCTQNLAQTLANGNNAGTYGINMNSQNITGANILGLRYNDAAYIDMSYGHILDGVGSHGVSGQVLRVNGSSPNTYVTWEYPNTLLTAGNGLSYNGNILNTVWSVDGTHIYNNNTGNVGVGLNVPNARLTVKGNSASPATEPLFEVKSRSGHTIFVIYEDSVRFYIDDDPAKTNKGTFAVSGRNTAKAFTNNFFWVTPDSSRVYTGDASKGFGVKNINGVLKESYMQLTPQNYLIGHEAGAALTTGLYNGFVGFNAGKSNTTGNGNIFIGYQAGFSNTIGLYNTFLGYQAGYHNIGNNNGAVLQHGKQNCYYGYQAGYASMQAENCVMIGFQAGMNNTANLNTFVGSLAGTANTSGMYCTFVGYGSGKYNTTGQRNTFFGDGSGSSNTTGGYNVYVGTGAGNKQATGSSNVCIGYLANYGSLTYGVGAANNNVIIGREAGMSTAGDGNILIGYQAGYNETGSNKLYIENSNSAVPLIGGDFGTNRVGINRMPTTYTLEVGGTIWANGATITAGATTWSDERYKTNIRTLNGSLDKILCLRGVNYEWRYGDFPDRNFPDGTQIGVIAQEIEKVFPEIVLTGADGYKSVDYSKLTAILIEAMKEQQEKIVTLETQNEDLISRIIKLENSFNSMSQNSEFSQK
jgi:hypothetical protein